MTVEVEQVGAPNIYDYHSLTMSLMADPGNNDGVLSATASGVGFANGTTGDITLAMGSLISSSFQLNPTTGIRSIGHFTEFVPAIFRRRRFLRDTSLAIHSARGVPDNTDHGARGDPNHARFE